jgi:adenosylhomocysteine nucleosidase
MTHTSFLRHLRASLCAAALGVLLTGCVGIYKGSGVSINSSTRLDATPRVAVISAFQPELTLLLARLSSRASSLRTASTSPPARCRASRWCCS